MRRLDSVGLFPLRSEYVGILERSPGRSSGQWPVIESLIEGSLILVRNLGFSLILMRCSQDVALEGLIGSDSLRPSIVDLFLMADDISAVFSLF